MQQSRRLSALVRSRARWAGVNGVNAVGEAVRVCHGATRQQFVALQRDATPLSWPLPVPGAQALSSV